MKFQCHKMLLASVIVLGGLITILALPSSLEAQSSYGAVVGTVTDNSGAVVSTATVTITNIGTNAKRTVQTGSTGQYRFAELIPANYKVEVEAPSFKHFVQASATVQVDNTLRVDAVLEVGAATETVTVTTQPPMLQTDSGTLGSMVEGKEVQEMPLNGRNIMNLIGLGAGIVPEGATSGSTSLNTNLGTHTSNAWANYQIGGGQPGQSAEYVDGTPINTFGGNNPALVVTQDAIQEFKIATNVPSPEFGRFAGGVIEMTTKSGSNAFHGSVYEYLRNNKLNANSFFSKASGAARPPWNVNQYGVVVSGPIKKDKLFFMGSWEALTARLSNPISTFIPSYNMNQGIFKNKVVVDPTGNCTTIAYYNASGGATTVTGANGPVAESVIPKSCIDPTGLTLAGYFAPPNQSSPDSTSYFINEAIGDDQYQISGRGDYKLSEKQTLFGRYTFWNLNDLSPREFPTSPINTGKSYNTNVTHQVALGDIYTINSSTILDIRASFLRENYKNKPVTVGTNATSVLGAGWAALVAQESFGGIPRLVWTGSEGFTIPGTTPNSNDYWNQYTLAGSLLKIVGKHTLKFGGEIRALQHNGFSGGLLNLPGNFTFNSATTGDEYAGMLMGIYQSATIATVKRVGTQSWPEGYYASDTYQATQNLTLNLGLRWELPGGITEAHNQNTVILPNAIDPVTGLMGALVAVNSPQYPSRSVLPVLKNRFAPRLTFAERLGSKAVVSGGYGVAYLPNDLVAGASASVSPVNTAQTTITTPQYHGLANPFGALTGTKITQPVFLTNSTTPNPFILQFKNQAVSSAVPTSSFPYAQQWNVNFSDQLMSSWVLSIGYAGAKGTHLPTQGSGPSIDQLPDQDDAILEAQWLAGATTAQLVAAGQPLRPYPYFQNLINASAYIKSSSYNSLQVTTQKRFRNGGLIMATYTFAKLMGDADVPGAVPEANAGNNTGGNGGSYQDYNNPAADRSLDAYDVPHRVVVSYVLPLPFGRNQRFGSRLGGFADKVVSGWALNGLSTFQSGFPLGIYESSGNYLSTQFGAGVIRPNIVPGCVKHVSASRWYKYQHNDWFNSACFVPVASTAAQYKAAPSKYLGQFQFGNQTRNDGSIRSQGIDNFDFAVLKSTKFLERYDLQFRAEFFNLFNHTQFAPPGLAIGGAVYDQVNTQANQPRLGQVSLRVNF